MAALTGKGGSKASYKFVWVRSSGFDLVFEGSKTRPPDVSRVLYIDAGLAYT